MPSIKTRITQITAYFGLQVNEVHIEHDFSRLSSGSCSGSCSGSGRSHGWARLGDAPHAGHVSTQFTSVSAQRSRQRRVGVSTSAAASRPAAGRGGTQPSCRPPPSSMVPRGGDGAEQEAARLEIALASAADDARRRWQRWQRRYRHDINTWQNTARASNRFP